MAACYMLCQKQHGRVQHTDPWRYARPEPTRQQPGQTYLVDEYEFVQLIDYLIMLASIR